MINPSSNSSNISGEPKLILSGLRNKIQKRINSKYFYDEKGSQLFELITSLEEYYPTRLEMNILSKKKHEIKSTLPKASSIIEFGGGSTTKVKKLIKALENPIAYFPVDISKKFLLKNAEVFSKENFDILVNPIYSDFNNFKRINKFIGARNNLIGFFPGSTIGNLSPKKAKILLKNIAKILKNGYLIIGVDMKKKKEIIEKAYNDSKGITAKFNQNILSHLNNKFFTSFEIQNFKHHAFFNERKNRIEMHLESKIKQEVSCFNSSISFKKGETIHTENSYKYSKNEFLNLINEANYKCIEIWSDEKEYFSVFCLKTSTYDD